jgi:hypothetical protein
MPLINLIIVLLVVGVALYLINTYVPMAPPIKTILNVVVILVVCLWLLGILGVGNIMIPARRGP